jgi:hypothetical protein
MAYTTHYLRFPSQEIADSKLTEVGYKRTETIDDETITFYTVTDQVGDIDIVGEIWNDDGVYDEESGEVITPPTKKDGWHINIICQSTVPPELQEYLVEPQNPYRVFA